VSIYRLYSISIALIVASPPGAVTWIVILPFDCA
jgi:hypothetical protein